MSSANLKALPEISFAGQSAAEVESAIVAAYERITGKTLYPATPERLFLEALAYFVTVQNNLIELAGRQNLLAYATGAHLDHLGALMGVERIPAQNATCMVRFAVSEPLAFAVPVPAGTRVATQDGTIVFATVREGEIPAGAVSTDVATVALTPGVAASGFSVGQINRLVDPLPYVATVANTTPTGDGADIEDDDRLRERIRIAPESYTVAGSSGAYEARVLEVSSEIAAVNVYSPEPGVVDVRFVMDGGELPDETTIKLVEDALNAETVRPLTDKIEVGAPETVEYEIDAKWYLDRGNETMLAATTAAVNAALEEYRIWQRSKPGRDINPTRLIGLLYQAGAKRVEVAKPVFTHLENIEIARETTISLAFGGLEDE